MNVASQVPLPDLCAQGGSPAPDLTIEFSAGNPPAPDELLCDWGGRYGLRLSRSGRDRVFTSAFEGAIAVSSDGRKIRVTAPRLPIGRGLHDILVRRVLPRVATLFDAAAIHAASIANDGRGLLLYGPSGAGKSTMTAALSRAGWNVLSDDISIIRGADEARIEPCTTGICVWTDTQSALGLEAERCETMAGYDGKVRYLGTSPAPALGASLAACVTLERDPLIGSPALERLGSSDGIKSIIQQLILFNPNGLPDERLPPIEAAVATVSEVPFFRLRYPSGFAALAEAEILLRQLLGG
ncbi:hypothetical protein [Sphingomonas sp.]|uniref:hypothetical protein n=1 Tax=Sphingomonas sp. TaxID=28214 RepID=UPI0025DA33C1|nr:hypothetical protein [Sphingomonas sp.]